MLNSDEKDKLNSLRYFMERGELIKGENDVFTSIEDMYNGMKINMDGQAIKEKLQTKAEKSQNKAEESIVAASMFRKTLQEEPAEDFPIYDYYGSEREEELKHTPKQYGYPQIYDENGNHKDENISKLMEAYNKKIRHYIECKRKIKAINGIVKAIDVNKKYSISPRLAEILNV